MKKIFSFLLVLCAVCLSAEEYNFLALGDIHYDGEKYHVSPPSNATRKHERERNFAMWNSGASDAVLAAASKAATASGSAFVVQLGDLIQGYCENVELQEKMFADGYPKVRNHFADHKFYAIRGNHDARIEKKYIDAPSISEFFPRVARDLGRESVSGTYTIRHGKDLFIFFDGFGTPEKSIAEVKQALDSNSDARYVFFLTHLPLLVSSPAYPGWMVPAPDSIRAMLAKVNAVVLTAHTHLPGFISVTLPEGTLSQLVVSSIGQHWKKDTERKVIMRSIDDLEKRCTPQRLATKSSTQAIKKFRTFRVNEYTIWSPDSGFAVIKVNDEAVVADIYADDSGKPVETKVLRKNAKVEDKK